MNILGFFFFYYRIKVINAKKIFNFVMNILYLLVIHNYLKPLESVTIKMKKIRFQINVNLLIFKKFQTPDMQWSYDVKGVLPHYSPPRGKSAQPIAGPHPDPRMRGDKMNYIRENLRLTTTAVSSPIKGAPLLTRSMKL